MKSHLVDIEVSVHRETEKAILVSLDGDKAKAVWLPLSRVEIHYQKRSLIITLPEQLAIDKGLV